MTAPLFNLLKSVPFLASVPPKILVEMAKSAQVRVYQPGEVLMAEGQIGLHLSLIQDGEVVIVKGGEVLARRGPGDLVGEMALLENQPRYADVTAVSHVQVIEIPYAPFRHIGQDAPTLRKMLSALSNKLRESQEKRLNELQRRERELAELTSLQKAFLSVVSHELLTPLSNAMLSRELLQRDPASANLPETIQHSLTDLGRHVDLAHRQVKSVIEYATLLQGQGDLFLQPADPADIVARALKSVSRSVTVDQPETLPPIQADWRRLADALFNLLDNACKFTPDDGTISLSVRLENQTVRFEVTDTGPGIDSAQLETLWEPFRAGHAVRRGLEGLGLGLPLTRYIVRAHGGDVWYAPNEPSGSRFGFWVPVPSKEETEN